MCWTPTVSVGVGNNSNVTIQHILLVIAYRGQHGRVITEYSTVRALGAPNCVNKGSLILGKPNFRREEGRISGVRAAYIAPDQHLLGSPKIRR